jgi:hypothetical protein
VTERFCKDCKYSSLRPAETRREPRLTFFGLWHMRRVTAPPEYMCCVLRSPVSGEPVELQCSYMRSGPSYDGRCGLEGARWEAKPGGAS